MIKKIAWNAFKNTGDINAFLELKEIENIEKNIIENKDINDIKIDEKLSEYVNFILTFTVQALDELDKFIFRDKKYVINKQLFKLYWCLEALRFFYEMVDTQTMLSILKRSAFQSEYTVREKAAQISILSENFNSIQTMLRKDDNYYVKTVFLNH